LVLTPDTTAVSQALENKIPASSFTVLSASFDQMPIYISMAQIGLMVRIPSLITSVSSPVKLAEYLACGLPVIAQTGIGDTDQILSERKAGIILKSDALTDADLHWLSLLASPEYRASVSSDCILLAKSHFSWDLYLDTYFQLYSRLSPLTP
jgi:glycosyltransferase involved in cell wall biosynthesis